MVIVLLCGGAGPPSLVLVVAVPAVGVVEVGMRLSEGCCVEGVDTIAMVVDGLAGIVAGPVAAVGWEEVHGGNLQDPGLPVEVESLSGSVGLAEELGHVQGLAVEVVEPCTHSMVSVLGVPLRRVAP